MLAGLLAAGARAETGSAASTQLQNLVYYPHAGRFRFTGQFTGSLQDSENTSSALDVKTLSRSTVYEKADATLAYGIVDGLRLSVNETELIDQKIQATDETDGVVSNNASHGFSDPAVTVTDRFVEAQDDGFSADAAGSFVPRLGRALAAGAGQSGNDLAEGWSATASFPLYDRVHADGRANEFELAPSVTRFFGGAASGAGAPSSTLTSSYWSAALELSNRYHVTSSWYVQPGVTATFQYAFHSAAQTPGAADTYQKVSANTSPNIHIGYLPAENLLIEASAAYAAQGTAASPAGTSTQEAQTYGAVQFQAAF